MTSARRASAGRPDRGQPARRSRIAAVRLAAGAAVLAVLGAGCADLPGSGAIQYTSTQLESVPLEEQAQQVPAGPKAKATAIAIVDGFVHASGDQQVAREFLTPAAARNWRPGWQAIVLKQLPLVVPVPPGKNVSSAGLPAPASAQSGAYKATGSILATVTNSGQYLQAKGAQPGSFRFDLVKVAGQWRISMLPSRSLLMLTQSAFEDDYVPRNLYYYDGQPAKLVPDPVSVPLQESPDEPATGLVQALLKGPDGWLSGARTSLPTGTRLLGVSITAANAVVNLGGATAGVTRLIRAGITRIEAQIVWTLTSSPYSPSAITSVQLKINGKPVTREPLLRQQVGTQLPRRSPALFYYLDRYGRVSVLAPRVQATPLAWPVRARITSIAVAPGGGHVAGIVPRRGGCSVVSGPPGRSAQVLSRRVSGGACTALSVDHSGNIWAAAGSHVWWLPDEGGAAQPVITPVPAGDTITALRVAADNVRVAMIVRPPAGSAVVLLGAISLTGHSQGAQYQIGPQMQVVGPNIANPATLTWYNANYIVVLSNAGRDSSTLYQVPLDGLSATGINTPLGRVLTVTATGSEAGPSGPLVLGMAARGRGLILRSAGLNTSWGTVTRGTAPAYPG